MKFQKLATDMLSPPTVGPGLLFDPFLILQVSLTAQIEYRKPDDNEIWSLMRFSTEAGEAIWARGRSVEYSYKDLRGTLALRVHVSREGLQPAALAVVLDKPNYLIWLDLQPIPEDILDCLPSGVVTEIRLNQAGKFAGTPHEHA